MPRTKVTFDLVREIGLALSEVAVGTMYSSPALKVRGRLLTCLAINKSAEPDSLVVAMDFAQRSSLLAEAPETLSRPIRCAIDHRFAGFFDFRVLLAARWPTKSLSVLAQAVS